ncbi:MAG TPA: M3 family oligoendopeptidase [Solirubrobacteraceae bacterium]|jgi:oligoendopeptidase F|nr:M3 family oligoendopeptidase [Solirubrobacteraceae bacterium]
MSSTAENLADPELLEAAWDLSALVDGDEEHGVERQLGEALKRSEAFQATHESHVAELDAPGLATAMHELAAINDLIGKAGSYASLQFSTDTADAPRGALLQLVQERATEIETKLLFFELEWAALPDERAEELLSVEELAFCAHYLRSARRYRPHLLSQPEETILAEKAIASQSAWGRLFGELVAALRVSQDSDEVPLDVALSRLQDPDRETRRAVAESVSSTLEPGLRTRSFIYNTLVHDKAVEDRLRHYPHWLASRNLANEVSDESVMALIQAVRARYDIPQRWYRLKARLLGVDRLADYDRSAPVLQEEISFSYAEARDLVLDTYASFEPRAGTIVQRFFGERWVDAPVRPHKRGGAFCAYTVPSVHPYVLLNFTARRRDVLTMAHELGHGLHAVLAQPQGVFHQSTPLTLAETASVFGEALVFGRMLDAAPNDEARLGLLAERIDGAIATVFRQMAMNRFEHLVHTRRRSEGELSVDRINESWTESQSELFGDSVEMTEGYRTWWSYVPHFINTPGYVYAYAYGLLLALSVYSRYLEEGPSFAPSYLGLLAAGGSRSPEELGAMVGIDLADPGFWDSGLALVEQQLRDAEELAAKRAG